MLRVFMYWLTSSRVPCSIYWRRHKKKEEIDGLQCCMWCGRVQQYPMSSWSIIFVVAEVGLKWIFTSINISRWGFSHSPFLSFCSAMIMITCDVRAVMPTTVQHNKKFHLNSLQRGSFAQKKKHNTTNTRKLKTKRAEKTVKRSWWKSKKKSKVWRKRVMLLRADVDRTLNRKEIEISF